MTEHLRNLLHSGSVVFSDGACASINGDLPNLEIDLGGVLATIHKTTADRVATVQVRFTGTRDVLVGSQGIRLSLRATDAWHWSRGWGPFDEVHVPLGRSTAMRTAEGLVLELLDAVSIRRTDSGMAVHRVDSTLAAGTYFCPRPVVVGFREPLHSTETLSVRCYHAAFPRWQLWPVPGTAGAALAVTDHADFDTVEGLSELADDPLFRGKLRMTKSVFVTNPLAPSPAALSSPGALRSIRQLADAGNEIAVHSTRPSGAGASGVVVDLAQLPLPVRTWIDHGPASRTNTSRNGLVAGSRDEIRHALRDVGVRNIWGYLDRASNPPALLVQDRRPSYGELLQERVAQATKAAAAGHYAHAAFLAIDGLAGPDSGRLRHKLPAIRRAITKQKGAPGSQPDPQHALSTGPDLHDVVVQSPRAFFAATMRPRSILPEWRPWFFTSVRINDPGGSLTNDALTAFITAGGAEVLHTYLLSSHPLAGWTGSWATSGARRGLLQLAEAAGEDLWVGTIDEWAEHLRAQKHLELEVDHEGNWRLRSPSGPVPTIIATGDGLRPPTPNRTTVSGGAG